MLLNLLKKVEVSKISIAGFDGFESDKTSNYSDESFQNDRYLSEFEDLNKEIFSMFTEVKEMLAGKCEIHFITPSRFDK